MKRFVRQGYGTHTTYKQVSKEEYEHLKNLPYAAASSQVQDRLPMDTLLGYGYYGFELEQHGDEYYLGVTVGNSCD